jgi:flagellar basal-body rod modification protein FlgD
MATQPVTAGQYFGTSPTPPKQQLDMNTFLQLITSEMQNQDPLNPLSNSEFASQLAQLGTVQGIDSMQKSATVQQAASLLGKTVTGTSVIGGVGTVVTGKAVQMTVQNGTYFLGVQNMATGQVHDIDMSSVQLVSQ